MHGVVLSDELGQALRPAIIWADSRTRKQLATYSELSPELRRTLANPIATGMAGPTPLWLKEHERQLYRRAAGGGPPPGWVGVGVVPPRPRPPRGGSPPPPSDQIPDSPAPRLPAAPRLPPLLP